jgi:hypothetical protein
MIKFKISEKEYNVPSFMSIENYSKIYKVKDFFSDDYFAAKLINIMTNAPVEDVLESDYQYVDYLATYIMGLVPTDERPKFYDRFELNGVKYGFFRKWQDLTFAEWVDLDTLSTKKPVEVLDLLHIICAIMYRPIIEEKSQYDFKIEKYDVELMKERAELFKKELDVKYILGAQFFFINFATRYSGFTHLSSIPTISTWTKIKLYWKLRKTIWSLAFNRHSDGMLSSTELLETILQSTNISTRKK